MKTISILVGMFFAIGTAGGCQQVRPEQGLEGPNLGQKMAEEWESRTFFDARYWGSATSPLHLTGTYGRFEIWAADRRAVIREKGGRVLWAGRWAIPLRLHGKVAALFTARVHNQSAQGNVNPMVKCQLGLLQLTEPVQWVGLGEGSLPGWNPQNVGIHDWCMDVEGNGTDWIFYLSEWPLYRLCMRDARWTDGLEADLYDEDIGLKKVSGGVQIIYRTASVSNAGLITKDETKKWVFWPAVSARNAGSQSERMP